MATTTTASAPLAAPLALWDGTSHPLAIGRCESCRQPDRGLYRLTPLDRRTRLPLDVRPFDVCIECA